MLKMADITKRFDGVCALDGVSAAFAPGEVHALMGENGAGKSTLGKIIAGVFPPTSGRCELDGRDVSFATTRDAQRAGICMIFQELDLFPHLSIAENIAIGNLNAPQGAWVDFAGLAKWCRPFLKQVDLTRDPSAAVGSLAMGHQQLVAIARALSMRARFLVMDEPTSSLTQEDVATLFGMIRRLRSQGVGILYVSHKMDEIFQIADRITVLRDGRGVGCRAIGETDRAEVVRLMVGRTVDERARRASCATTDKLFTCEALCTNRLRDVSFDLHRGEVLGVAGLVGAGRSELGRALFGLDEVSSGRMTLRGEAYVPRNVRDAMEAGVALQPEDRKREGLMMQMSVRENASMACVTRYSQGGWIDGRREASDIADFHERVHLKAASAEVAVSTLSGGNQQKVLLARWLLCEADLFFFDDPTRGVDVGAKQDIYAVIAQQADAGKGVIFVSSELPELLRCCDRILVLNAGRSAGILDAASATQEAIMERAAT